VEHVTAEKLSKDMHAVVVDAEELLKATAGQTGDRIEKIRARAEQSLRSARHRLQETGEAVQAKARAAALSVDDQVHKSPWSAVGVAAGVGLLVGILIGRR